MKQSAVSSLILFCLYIKELLESLCHSGDGCYLGEKFEGAVAYADDNVHNAPSASALRKLLYICDEFVRDYCVVFKSIHVNV
jgi:hypothetical protein